MKLTEDHGPTVAILTLTLLSYLIINFPKVTAFAIVVILFSVQSKHNEKVRKANVVAARQSEESSEKKKDGKKANEDDSKSASSNDPKPDTPQMTKNDSRASNIGSGTVSMKDVEQRKNELLFAHMYRFKTFPHPPQRVLNNELHFAFVDLDNRGSKKDIYMSVENDNDDDAHCNRFSRDE